MAKINITFNNKEYQIDESALSSAASELKQHFSTAMSGTGAIITFGGTSYGIDSAKLSAATNAFVSYLGTVSGSGYKVKVGDIEYGIDSNKVSGVVSEFEGVLGGLNSGGGGAGRKPFTWDGSIDGENVIDFCNMGQLYMAKVSDEQFSIDDLCNAKYTQTLYNTRSHSGYEGTITFVPDDFMQNFGLLTTNIFEVVYCPEAIHIEEFDFDMEQGLYVGRYVEDYGDY